MTSYPQEWKGDLLTALANDSQLPHSFPHLFPRLPQLTTNPPRLSTLPWLSSPTRAAATYNMHVIRRPEHATRDIH